MILTVKISGLHPETQEIEIIEFLKQVSSNVQVRAIDLSGLNPEYSASMQTDNRRNEDYTRLCTAIVDGPRDAVLKLSGRTLHGRLVNVAILNSGSNEMSLPSASDPKNTSEPNSGINDNWSAANAFTKLKDKAAIVYSKINVEEAKVAYTKAVEASNKGIYVLTNKVKPILKNLRTTFNSTNNKKPID